MVTKTAKVDKAIRKVKTLQHEYNELNYFHFKSRNDLKVLQTDYDQLIRDYGNMEAVGVQ